MASANGLHRRPENPFAPKEILGADGRPARGRAPEADLAVPHVIQFASLMGTSYKAFLHDRWDNAVKMSREDAESMREDCHLMSLMNERKLGTVSLKWHIDVDNDRNPRHKALKAGLTHIVKQTPRFKRMLWALLEAIWYGRYASQHVFQWRFLSLPDGKGGEMPARRVLTTTLHQPVHGDSIGHEHDGTPYLLVNGTEASRHEVEKTARIITTSVGGRGLSLVGGWRRRFILHSHDPFTSSFFKAEQAEAIHGVGIRSIIFWFDWLRKEWLANISDWCARTGLGVRIWYYQAGNDASKRAVTEAARTQSDKTNILMPRTPGTNAVEGLEYFDTANVGAQLLLDLIKHIEESIERYIIGQTLSAGTEGNGLGGTGVADMHAATKAKIIAFDAENLGETLTEDWLDETKRWSFPEYSDVPARFMFEIEQPDAKERMEAAKTFIDLGGTVREDDARAVVGFAEPTEGERILGGQPAMPGPGGLPGQPGPNGPDANGQHQFPGEDPYADAEDDADDQDEQLGYAATLFEEQAHPRGEGGKFTFKHVQKARSDAKAGKLKVNKADEPVTSDATGKKIRRYVELETGHKLHPDELWRAKANAQGGADISDNERLTVHDPAYGVRKVKSFDAALSAIGKGQDNHPVTVQSAHGYASTMPRQEWGAHAGSKESFSEWHDRQGGASAGKPQAADGPSAQDPVVGEKTAKGIKERVSKAIADLGVSADKATDLPGIKQLKTIVRGAIDFVSGLQRSLYSTMESRYGSTGAKAIFAASLATGSNPAIMPPWFVALPGSSLLAQLPLMGIAEAVLQTGRAASAVGKALSGDDVTKAAEHVRDRMHSGFLEWLEANHGADASDKATDDYFAPRSEQARLFQRPGDPDRYDAKGNGRWITIGGQKGEDGKRKGGSPVYVQDGRITKGHPRLTGKKLDAIDKDDAGDEGSTHRQQLRQSREYARAVWAKKARKEGIDTKALHDTASMILANDREYVKDRRAVLTEARAALDEFGRGYKTIQASQGRGGKSIEEGAQIRGLDEVAEDLAGKYPEVFRPETGEHGSYEDQLFAMLEAGNPEYMPEEDAYEQAFDLAMEHKAAAPVTSSGGWDDDEPVPFGADTVQLPDFDLGASAPLQYERTAQGEDLSAKVQQLLERFEAKGREPAQRPVNVIVKQSGQVETQTAPAALRTAVNRDSEGRIIDISKYDGDKLLSTTIVNRDERGLMIGSQVINHDEPGDAAA